MDFSTTDRALRSLVRRAGVNEKVKEVAKQLQGAPVSEKDCLEAVTKLLDESLESSDEKRWEGLAVGLYLATQWIASLTSEEEHVMIYADGPRVPSMLQEETAVSSPIGDDQLKPPTRASLESLASPLLSAISKHLEHKEPRVRTLVAKAVGSLVRLDADVAIPLHDRILSSLFEHLDAGRDTSNPDYSKSSTGALDDTTGWRALETNWIALASYIAACSSDYLGSHPLSTRLLEACRYSCVEHLNRHVRAAGLQVLEQWVLVATKEMLTDPSNVVRQTAVTCLKSTLADNWSQVRMAGSVLCRTFWIRLSQYPADERQQEALYPILIPRMCLNRFYLAQGVKLYSLDTWKQVFADEGSGLQVVAENAGAVSRYYVMMADADNHVVREAACQAIAELAQKLGRHPNFAPALSQYVAMLLQALLMCFHDESWPVRDEACLACGTFCRAYPDECQPELATLKERWMEQLTDQIWSVREDAAVALGDASVAYPDILWEECLKLLRTKLPSAREQEPMTREAYKAHQNDMEMHTDSQLYSCGSLAPKLRKGGAGRIGCSSCDITRPKAPWEATDGCIYLLREMVIKSVEEPSLASSLDDDVLLSLMTELADVCRVKHFPQADDLRATLWQQLPVMANALGKQRFKRLYLELFIDLMIRNLEDSTASALSKHAAGQCAFELSALVGPGIFQGRLDDFQREVYDRAMRERASMPMGPPMEGFSPFGPPSPRIAAFGQGGLSGRHAEHPTMAGNAGFQTEAF